MSYISVWQKEEVPPALAFLLYYQYQSSGEKCEMPAPSWRGAVPS
jgi:hypothetical protein